MIPILLGCALLFFGIYFGFSEGVFSWFQKRFPDFSKMIEAWSLYLAICNMGLIVLLIAIQIVGNK